MSAIDSVRGAYENLNDREKKLVTTLATVLVCVVVFLPLWLATSAISEVEEENAAIRAVLRDISRSSAELAEREAAREAAARRYDTKAPPLGSFLEAKARDAGYERPLEVTDQPEKVAGGFTRRHVRANLPGVGLRSAIDMLVEVENSPYPVAIERLSIEHFQAGDRYNVEVGLFAFDRESSGGDDDDDRGGTGRRPSGRAGPPSP
jgi:hypothetical protein